MSKSEEEQMEESHRAIEARYEASKRSIKCPNPKCNREITICLEEGSFTCVFCKEHYKIHQVTTYELVPGYEKQKAVNAHNNKVSELKQQLEKEEEALKELE